MKKYKVVFLVSSVGDEIFELNLKFGQKMTKIWVFLTF